MGQPLRSSRFIRHKEILIKAEEVVACFMGLLQIGDPRGGVFGGHSLSAGNEGADSSLVRICRLRLLNYCVRLALLHNRP